jgi:hypothetical protein
MCFSMPLTPKQNAKKPENQNNISVPVHKSHSDDDRKFARILRSKHKAFSAVLVRWSCFLRFMAALWSFRCAAERTGLQTTRRWSLLRVNTREDMAPTMGGWGDAHAAAAEPPTDSRRRPSLDATCTPTGDDPLQQLPHDLAARIFATLPPHSRARCAAVCRSWRDMLRDLPAEQLWGNLDFTADPACKVRFTFHFIFF